MAGVPDDLKLETEDFDGVDVLAVGGPYFGTGSPEGGDFYTEADLAAIADNTRQLMETGELKAPVKLGHSMNQKLAKESGFEDGEMPALGWLDNPRVEDGKLKVDVRAVPRKLAALVKSGAFRTRSLELRGYVSQKTGGKIGPAIKGLALMGAKAPAVRTLDDVIALYSDEVDEEEVQTREYGEMVWNPDLGYRWVQHSVTAALNPPGETHFHVLDVGPESALVSSSGTTSGGTTYSDSTTGTGTWVVPFAIADDDTLRVAPGDEWLQGQDRWAEKAREYAELSGERLSGSPADTSREMGDEMNEFEDAPEVEEQTDDPVEGEGDMVSVPRAEYEALKAGAEAGSRAERKLAEMERDTFFEEAVREGKVDPAQLEDWTRRYDEQPELVKEIVTSLQPNLIYLREFGSDSDGRDTEDAAERDLGDALDEYMGIPENARVIGGKA